MSNSNLRDDIAFMKSLAEQGGQPVINGAILFWAGAIFGSASLVQYAFAAGFITLRNPWHITLIWLGAGVLFAVAAFLSLRGKRGAVHPASKAINSVWSAVGISIFVLGVCLTAAGTRVESIETLTALIAPVILILYGIAWWVAAVVSGQGWLKFICAGCFVTAPMTAFMATLPEQNLAYAVCLFLFAAVPGLILMRAPKD